MQKNGAVNIQLLPHFLIIYLSNHNREGKDSDKIVDELKDRLKQGGGIWQTANRDQSFHRKVVTANVTKRRERKVLLEEHWKRKNF